jgi:hypothetical protein
MDRMPTHDDANLILRLYELRREDKLRAARSWFTANFYCKNLAEAAEVCPPGSEENAYLRMVTSYWDMVASFITTGVLNEELFFQSGTELLLTWVRIRDVLPELRALFNSPNYLKNLETVALQFTDYWNRRTPGAFDAFVARMGSRPAQAQKAD